MDHTLKELTPLIYEFFFAFSRFEYSLKLEGYLENNNPGAKAKPGWGRFEEAFREVYVQIDEGTALINARPMCQMVGLDQALQWEHYTRNAERSELGNTIDALNVVRNNLFHGGKHGSRFWADPERSRSLMGLGLVLLEHLSQVDRNLQMHYSEQY